jgi:predicted AlkP superfamily phosphohydrolase/phosphomutase
MSQSRRKVLMVAIDAAESTLIERWTTDGTMPHLQRLRERGAYGRMASTADWLAGTPWCSFYTGTLPPEHGFLFHLQWRPDLMRHDRPTQDWLPMTPFYRAFGQHGRRTIAIDVPITYEVAPGEPFDGIEVTSWSTHDKVGLTTAYPPGTMQAINRKFGREPIIIEATGVQPAKVLLRLRERMLRSVRRQAELCIDLMAREPWDFVLLALGAAHRGGHKLWNRTSIAGELATGDEAAYDGALRDIYVACDEAIGNVLKQAGDGVTVLACSMHGMRDNYSRFDLTPAMLDRILDRGKPATGAPAKPPHSVLQHFRNAVPIELRTALKSRMPEGVQDALSRFWRPHDKKDWSRTPAFCLMGDLQALVQINLKGRERDGIIEPGAEYEQWLSEITEGLLTFVDADTGQPLIKRIGRGNEMYPEATNRRVQPDLILDWVETPACLHRAITSPKYGTIDWPHPGHPLDGRSGHHVSEGWLVAVGEGIVPGTAIGSAHSLDLNATIHALLGVPRPDHMRGRVLESLC